MPLQFLSGYPTWVNSGPFFNKVWLEFTGRTLEQEIGNGWREGVHPEDQQRLDAHKAAYDAREPLVMQYRLRRNDGEYRWISDQGVPRYDAQGRFAGYIGSCVDVTDLLTQQRALHQFEERVALAAEAAHLGVWEFDTITDRIWISDKVREIFKFPEDDEISYSEFQERIHPDDRAARDRVMQRTIRTQGTYETEYRIVLPDGTVHWIAGRGRYLPEKDGKSARVLGVSMDITERKQAEELFHLATEASPSGTVLVDHEGKIVLVNAHIEELFGFRVTNSSAKTLRFWCLNDSESHLRMTAPTSPPRPQRRRWARPAVIRPSQGWQRVSSRNWFESDSNATRASRPRERCGHFSAPRRGRGGAAKLESRSSF